MCDCRGSFPPLRTLEWWSRDETVLASWDQRVNLARQKKVSGITITIWYLGQSARSDFVPWDHTKNQVSQLWTVNHRSYERNLSNCVQKPEKVRTSRYRCDALTNWAMKPLTLGAGHLCVLMSTWRMDVKWYMKCFIYRTADLKSSKPWSSQLWTQFKQLHTEAWKSQDFNGVVTRDLAIPVRRFNQLSYEATDVGIARYDHGLLDFKSAVQYIKHFIYHFTY